ARIAAGGPPKVEARAAAGDRNRLREGLAVRFALAGVPGVAGRGVVREIAPLGGAGGTGAGGGEGRGGTGLPGARAGGGVRGGVGVRGEPAPGARALTVPEESGVMSEWGAAVYVDGAGVARRKPLTTGGRAAGRVEVTGGLAPGDKVVVDGAALLSEGARVTP